MGFFNANFLEERRLEWKNSIDSFQYQVNGVWYNASISSSELKGNKLIYFVDIPTVPDTAHIISGMRILDKNGKEAGMQKLYIERSGFQPLLAVYEFPIQEV